MAQYKKHRPLYHSRRWILLRRRIFKRDGFRCRICGKAGRLECDHAKPITQGGAFWNPANLQTVCRSCHLQKTAGERPKDPEREAWRVFRDELR